MSDPSLALQGAIVAALKADPPVAGGRIYDAVPASAAFPYVSLGEGDALGDDNACWDASDITLQVHVWSRTVGFPECKAIAAEVRRRCRTEFALDDFVVSNSEHVVTRFLRDPDGLTRHAVVEFRYLVDHDV